MIATILMVAITVVLAAVLYVMVTSFLDFEDNRKPIVQMSTPECIEGACEGAITGVQPAKGIEAFRVTVFADGDQVILPTPLVAGTDISGGGLTLRYTDVGGEGRVTAGDTYRLVGVSPGVEYEIVLLWRDGSVVQSASIVA